MPISNSSDPGLCAVPSMLSPGVVAAGVLALLYRPNKLAVATDRPSCHNSVNFKPINGPLGLRR